MDTTLSTDHYMPGSTVIISLSPKYYWLLYLTMTDTYIGICTTVHPFKYVHHANTNATNQKWHRITLIDWKEITKEEFSLWLELNPKLAESMDMRDIHQMD